jgi:hypothetical protein
MFPKRFAIDEATSMEAAAMMLVVKKREPSIPSLRLNFFLKNQITQELVAVSMKINEGEKTGYLQRCKT